MIVFSSLVVRTFRIQLRKSCPHPHLELASRVNGKVFYFVFGWKLESSDPWFPGEEIFLPHDSEYPSTGPEWFAVGDLVEVI